MSETVIKVENLSKQYRLGEVGTGTLSHDLKRWWYRARGKEDPYLKIGEANDRSTKGNSDYVWALQDINFEVKQGEVLGIIGRNGAGKSTLLKILSKTTTPTTGHIKVKGRIASLLEVGTGFHPEMTGRENIFLNGAILGMTRREIKNKFDEIVDFAGVERYIDTPVKRYSSGMYVRLAFAVAAHLEPEILIVDEVLAVGDAEFQEKCLGKMKDVSVNEGRTVLFVSHNIPAILQLTNQCLYLKNGSFVSLGNSQKIVNQYLISEKKSEMVYMAEVETQSKPTLVKCKILSREDNNIIFHDDDFKIEFHVNIPFDMQGFCLSFQIFDLKQKACFYNWIFDSEQEVARVAGLYKLECTIPKFKLYKGYYNLSVHMAEQKGKTFYGTISNICPFEVMMAENHEWGWSDEACVFLAKGSWITEKIL